MKFLALVLLIASIQLSTAQEQNNSPERLRAQLGFLSYSEFKNRYTPVNQPYEKSTYVIDGFFERNPTTEDMAEELGQHIIAIEKDKLAKFNPSTKKNLQERVVRIITQCPKQKMAEIMMNMKPKVAIAGLAEMEDPIAVCDILFYMDAASFKKITPKLPGLDEKASSDY